MVAPLAVLLVLVTVISAGAWYVTAQLGSLDDLSTPPPEVVLEDLEEEVSFTVDTRASQEYVRQEQEREAAVPDATPVPEGSLTALMMGVDARPGEPIDIKVRADSLAIVHADAATETCRMLSIPRDTRLLLPGYGYSKVNHALAVGGVPYQQLVVQDYLGVEIDHYGLIDFAGMAQLIDALGGVVVANEDYAFELDGYRYPIGNLTLDGEAAVLYARYRGGPDGDYGRQMRQQQVARELLGKGASLDLITAVPELLDTVQGHVRTDLSPREMVDSAQTYRSVCTVETLETDSLEGTIDWAYDDLAGQELLVVYIEPAEVEQKVAWLLGA